MSADLERTILAYASVIITIVVQVTCFLWLDRLSKQALSLIKDLGISEDYRQQRILRAIQDYSLIVSCIDGFLPPVASLFIILLLTKQPLTIILVGYPILLIVTCGLVPVLVTQRLGDVHWNFSDSQQLPFHEKCLKALKIKSYGYLINIVVKVSTWILLFVMASLQTPK